MLKKIVIGIVAVAALAIGGWMTWAATLPEVLDIEARETLNLPKDTVYETVNDLKNWPKWTMWNDQNPQFSSLKYTYEEQTTGKGAKYSWTSDDGDGWLRFDESSPEKGVHFTMQFGQMPESKGSIEFVDKGESTETIWKFGMNPPFALRPMMSLAKDAMVEEFKANLRGIEAFVKDGTINVAK